MIYTACLVLESPVLVLTEERNSHARQGIVFEDLKALLEGVVDVDLARAVEDDDAAGTAKTQTKLAKPTRRSDKSWNKTHDPSGTLSF